MRKTKKIAAIAYIYLSVWAVLILAPFYYMIQRSLENVGLVNYLDVFRKTKFYLNFANSVLVAVITLLVLLSISVLAAYAFSKMKFRLKTVFFLAVLSGLMIGPAVVVFPVYKVVLAMGLQGNFLALVGPYCGLFLPSCVLFIKNYMDDIPNELLEASVIDGCSPMKTLMKVIFPLLKPVLISVGVVQFLNVWNEFFYAYIMLPDEKMKTLAVVPIQFMSRFNGNLPLVFAMMVVIELPAVIIYLCLNKYIRTGLVGGAVKG